MADGSQSTAFLNTTCEGNNSWVTVILVTALNYVTRTGSWDNDRWPVFVHLHHVHYVASITSKKCQSNILFMWVNTSFVHWLLAMYCSMGAEDLPPPLPQTLMKYCDLVSCGSNALL